MFTKLCVRLKGLRTMRRALATTAVLGEDSRDAILSVLTYNNNICVAASAAISPDLLMEKNPSATRFLPRAAGAQHCQ